MQKSTEKARVEQGGMFFWAIALFAIMCGAIMLLAGGPSGAEKNTPGDVSAVIKTLDEASNALEATDYGETREHLKDAREALSRIVE